MPHHKGYRAKTRDMFSKAFRHHGMPTIAKTHVTIRRGDFVDVKTDPAIQKGMPYKYYHGRTGKVFNIAPHSVGVIINKTVNNRIMKKRINLRVEHVTKSKCRDEFLNHVKKNEELKKAGQKGTKRLPEAPREAHLVVSAKTQIVDQHPTLHTNTY